MRQSYYRFGRQQPKSKYRINQYISCPEVRVIDAEGQQLGVMPTFQALQMARDKELDLIEVSPLAQPPVCRIMDFGKFQYQQARQQSKHKQKKSEVKCIRLSLKIGQHDIETKLKQAEKFFAEGHKVKLELRLRGREKAFKLKGREVATNFISQLSTKAKLDKPLEYQGGTIIAILSKNN